MLTFPTDVGNEAQIEAMVARTHAECGRLDILVTSAGGATFGPIIESRTEDWDAMMNINLRGTYLCCKHALKVMIPQGRGHILNVLSIASHAILPCRTGHSCPRVHAG